MNKCLNCGFLSTGKKYCSYKCRSEFTLKSCIERWKRKEIPGHKGVAMVIKPYVRDYILKKYNYKCTKYGWDKKHPINGESCCQVDHIDGDASNSWEENLDLLCPNCHSLTLTHRNFNKTKGKRFRKYGASDGS